MAAISGMQILQKETNELADKGRDETKTEKRQTRQVPNERNANERAGRAAE